MINELHPFLDSIKNQIGSSISNIEKIQTLWSGYGGIYRLHLKGSVDSSVIVKLIDLRESKPHSRGWATNLSHQRKLKSYQIENYWYENYVVSLPESVKVPRLLYSEKGAETQVLVLEDLSIDFPVLKQHCSFTEAKVVVKWLAQFHAHFLNSTTKGLWPVGSYWHLDTRPDELNAMANSPLKANAKKIDHLLNNATFKTIIHGDAKVANFCFSESGESVAAVDFQYVGGGVGVKDLIYFLGSCLSEDELELYEEALVDAYFEELKSALQNRGAETYRALEKEWRFLYPVAWADFNRFLLGWMPEHQKLHKQALSKNEVALQVLNLNS